MKCRLIPWDPESDEHVERLVQQRIACGWNADKVASEWKEDQLAGRKCIYWIEKRPLKDTSRSAFIRQATHEPSLAWFVPVGHISLARDDPGAKHLDLGLPSDGAVWIKGVYVSGALQNRGLGRAAMDAAEAIAARPPLNARTLVLDTVQKDDQMRADYAVAMYGRVAKMTNEDWYIRRGYRVLKVVPGYYGDLPDNKGRRWHEIRTTFLRKDLES
ncbi:hypothetical protein ACRALDRAFT_1064493 [Sodiomyces alcalophilus JCM 7366]|uniref:uncharacterized protein n=1 Tax=Sodiomyces alcalophilus JCM 7366 TaxID=591952 RepID=UPI0039B541BE